MLHKDHILVIADTPKVSRYKSAWGRNYYLKNRDKINKYNHSYGEMCLKSWEGYIPLETTCQICSKTIYFNKKNPKTSIHFDHRNDLGKTGYKTPANWLLKHRRTAINEKIWESFNFGFLCLSCNSHLPTKNRNNHVSNMVKYVFGKEAHIVL